VPHVFGRTDPDVAYGLAWAHAEDDFQTIQGALLAARGRLATALGRAGAPNDYMVQLLRISDVVDAGYERDLSPETRALCEAYADGTISIARRVTHPHTSSSMFRSCLSRPQPRVDIVLSYPGSDGTFIDAAVAAGARGIVAAGFGSGQCTPGENDALVRAEAKGITVVQATRVLGGAVPLAAVMRRRHFISSVDLQPPKARILLMLALALTDDAREIQQMFKEY